MKIKLLAITAIVVLAAAISACTQNTQASSGSNNSSSAVSSKPQEEVYPSETTVGGVDISGKTKDEALKLCQKSIEDKLAGTSVSVKIGESVVKIDGKELEAVDVCDELLTQIIKTRESGDYSLDFSVDNEKIISLLEPVSSKYTKEAKNAAVESFDVESETFTFTDSVNGRRVDLTATADEVKKLIETGKGGSLAAVVVKNPATITAETLKKKFTKLASFSTVSDNNENGNHNMALSFERINGTVLEKGEEFSFNQIVGDSTYDGSGFLPAGGLVNGVLVPLYGGGICQASSTIYGAALRAGMEITLRDCHSSPSTYVPMGLDATVSYDDLDFRFVNPYDYPVYIVSYMSGVELYVSIYGCQPDEWDEIEVNAWMTEEVPIPEGVRYLEDSSLAAGEYYVKSYGNNGYYAAAERVFYKNGEVVKTEELSSSYYGPMRKTYMVGPGTNTDNVSGESGNANNTPAAEPVTQEQPAAPEPEEVAVTEPENPPEPVISEPASGEAVV